MKKNLLKIIIFLFSFTLFAFSTEDFSDCKWFDQNTIEYITKYNKAYTSFYNVISFKFPKVNNSSNYDDWGFYSVNGFGRVAAIYSVKMENENTISFEYGWYPIVKDEEVKKDDNTEICTITILNENKIILDNAPYVDNKILYRNSYNNNPNLIDGIVNDNNVRIRTEPSTQGIILGKLHSGDKVSIINKSDLSKADGVENFWYQIQVEGYPVCWIFGEYVTLKSSGDEYTLLYENRNNFEKLPIINGTELIKKDIFSDIFFDGTWCTESQWKNLQNENLIYHSTGLYEKAKTIKEDICCIEVYLSEVDFDYKSHPSTITYHNVVNKLKDINYKGKNEYQFYLKNNTIMNVKIIDISTIEISYNNKNEIWKRITPTYDSTYNFARICYDGVCLFKSPKVSEKNQYTPYANAGQIVTILYKGEKEKIGDFEDYWYKVSVANCEITNYDIQTGNTIYWIYGAFLDFM